MFSLTLFVGLWWFLVTCSWHSSQCIHACYRLQWRIFHSLLVSLRWFPQYHTKCATPRSHNCNQSCTWFHLEPHLEKKMNYRLKERKGTEEKAAGGKKAAGRLLKNELFRYFWQYLFSTLFCSTLQRLGQKFRWYMFLIYFSQESCGLFKKLFDLNNISLWRFYGLL